MKKGKALRRLWAVVALFAMMTNTVLPTVEVFANETNSTEIQESASSSNELTVDSVTDSIDKQSVKENLESEAEIQSEVDQQENANANDSPDDKKKKVDIGTQAATTSLEVFHGIDWYYGVQFSLRTEDNGDEYVIRTLPDGTSSERKITSTSDAEGDSFQFNQPLPQSASRSTFYENVSQSRFLYYRLSKDRKKIIPSASERVDISTVQFDQKMEFGEFIGMQLEYFENYNQVSFGAEAKRYLFFKNGIVSSYEKDLSTNKLIKIADSSNVSLLPINGWQHPFIEIDGKVIMRGENADNYVVLSLHTISKESKLLEEFPTQDELINTIGKATPWWNNGVKDFPSYSGLTETIPYKNSGAESILTFGVEATNVYLTNVFKQADIWSDGKAAYITNMSKDSNELNFDFTSSFATANMSEYFNYGKDFRYTFQLSKDITDSNTFKTNVGKHFYAIKAFDIGHLSYTEASTFPENMIIEYWLDSDNTLKVIISGDAQYEPRHVKANFNNVITFENLTFPKSETGKVKITKVDSVDTNKKLAGATFKITNTETKAVWLAESDPTASNGELTITDIPIGKYTLEEVKAPTGYDLSTKKISFEVTADNVTELQTFDFENTKKTVPKGKVTIKKYETGDTQKELIADAEFTLFKKDGTKETEVAKKTSVKGKELVFDELALGDYVLKETKAPAGYETATYEKTFTLTESALAFTYEVANTKTPAPTGKVSIKKFETGDTQKELIADAEFTLYKKEGTKETEVAKKTSVKGKELVFDELALGDYVLKETKAPAGYETATYEKAFTVTESALAFTYEVANTKTPEPTGKVSIKKYETGDTQKELIADAEFTLYKKEGTKETEVAKKTSVKGKELVFDELALGDYVLKETKAPAGYETATYEKAFTVTESALAFTYEVA
ncbi:MAG: collagen binding domain-containing protein, partial [Enterococcus avium]